MRTLKDAELGASMTWLDIEGAQYWMGDYATNQAFMTQLVSAARETFPLLGVYSSYYEWTSLFGDVNYSPAADLPLWYADYDGVPSFADFKPFGGWHAPHVKQFKGDIETCGQNVDLDWYPE